MLMPTIFPNLATDHLHLLRFIGSHNGLLVVGQVDKHTLSKPLIAWRDPAPMPVLSVELAFVGVEGRYVRRKVNSNTKINVII